MNRRRNRFRPVLLFPFLLLSWQRLAAASDSWQGGARFDPGCSDPRAIAVADLTLRAVGGRESLERVRFLRFSFVLLRGEEVVTRRTHLWDRSGRRLRYEARDDSGSPIVAILALDTRMGQVYRAGRLADRRTSSRILAQAYEAWRNDSYWLLLPYRMKEAGVCLSYGGEEVGGDRHDRIYLTFTKSGALPGERYRADIDRETHLLDLWSSAPEDEPPDRPTTLWQWRDWRLEGGLLLAREKVSLTGDEPLRIIHPTVQVHEAVADSEFFSPTPLPPDPATDRPWPPR